MSGLGKFFAPFVTLAKQPIESFIRLETADDEFTMVAEDGSLISYSHYSVMFKIDFCSKLKWINDEEKFHHSQMLNHEGSIWVGSQLNPPSKHVIKYQIDDFDDDSIVKIDTDGKILFKKSVIEILIDNKILPNN